MSHALSQRDRVNNKQHAARKVNRARCSEVIKFPVYEQDR